MAANRLGKGLSALIPDISPENQPTQGRLADIEVSRITPNPFQPRQIFEPKQLEELKQSIAENGVIQPITVRERDSGFEMIAGERRLRAVQELGHSHIPAFVLNVRTDQEMLELSLIENVQREDLNAIDEAKGYRALIDHCRLTQEQVAAKIGKDRTTITNSLRLLKLPEAIQDSLVRKEITAGHARALLSLDDRSEQRALWKRIVNGKASVRQAEQFVKKKTQVQPKSKVAKTPPNPFLREAEDKLRAALATKVSIVANKSGDGGRVEIDYYSEPELERIVESIEQS